jgi:hypothetical protein
MPDYDESGGNRQPTKRRRIWFIPVGVALLAVIAGFLWAAGVFRDRRSVEERLAEIEAARAIPDSENAAILYNELLQDPNAASPLDDFPESPAGDALGRVLREPWRSKDHPELVVWVKEHQSIIDRLLEATRLERCRFPVSIDIIDTSPMERGKSMRQWGFLLSTVANNDLAEGRIDAATAKWQCLLQMESHLRQQPILIDHLAADTGGRLVLESMVRFLMTGDATESHVQEIEAMRLPTEDNWAQCAQAVRSIEDLRSQKLKEPLGPLDRLQYYFTLFRVKRAINAGTGGILNRSTLDDSGCLYRRNIVTGRGIRILIALKRYKSATSHWPQSLDEVKPSL